MRNEYIEAAAALLADDGRKIVRLRELVSDLRRLEGMLDGTQSGELARELADVATNLSDVAAWMADRNAGWCKYVARQSRDAVGSLPEELGVKVEDAREVQA